MREMAYASLSWCLTCDRNLLQVAMYVVSLQVAALPCMADDTVFAVHAPHGTSLEVPDPGECPKHYRCYPISL